MTRSEEGNDARGDGAAALRCVFFGDSITAGQYVSTEHDWTSLLRERLTREAEFADVQFSVGAVSGSTSRQSLERFPHDVQVLRPQVVTIQFGLNDCNRWQTDGGLPRVSERAFEANLLEMVARARRFGTSEVILSTNHPTLRSVVFDDGVSYADCARCYNGIIRSVASQSGAELHDVEAEFGSRRDDLPTLLLPAPDVLHLSVDGHAVYADLLEPRLRKCLGRARETASERRPVQ